MTNKTETKQNKFANALNCGLNWVDERFPLTSNVKAHLTEYYAPKNFNFWYFFGSLAMLVLVLQIVTGMFLTMHYKPDADLAFGSVEYIMRDVPWVGSFVICTQLVLQCSSWWSIYICSVALSMVHIVILVNLFGCSALRYSYV